MSSEDLNLLDDLRRHILAARRFDPVEFDANRFAAVVKARLQRNGLEKISDYIDCLEVKPSEYDELFRDLFDEEKRNMAVGNWVNAVLEKIFNSPACNEPLRLWNIGCGNGETAYLFAMLLCERLGISAFQKHVKIFATDTDEAALSEARHAEFSADTLSSVPKAWLDKYFVQHEGRFTFRADLRRLLIFGRHDILQDPPISKMDLILARFVLPFYNIEKQDRALARMRFAVRDGRWLLLGSGTRLGEQQGLMVADEEHCFLRKTGGRALSNSYNDPSRLDPNNGPALDDVAFENTPVAHVVVDGSGILALANARARQSFGILHTDFGKPLQDLEISYRPVELRSLMEQAQMDGRPVVLKSVARPAVEANVQFFDIYVRRLVDAGTLLGTSIQYIDTTEYQNLKNELISLNHQLQTANEELQSAHEELETTNEELQSTNEELETTNEELQSTNEELQTMNEELHSANSELSMTNVSQRELAEQMNSANLFLEAILASIHAAVVVVTNNFEIRVWNRRAMDMFGLRSEEVTGHNLFSLDIGLPVEKLKAPLREFIQEGKKAQTLELPAVNRRGKSINCRVRMSPLGQGAAGIILIIDEVGLGNGEHND